MANELAELIENRLAVKDWSVADLVRETGMDAGQLTDLLAPRELPGMPDRDVVQRLATALDVREQVVVMAAARGCGLATSAVGDRTGALRAASDEDLLRELRRRLVAGRNSADVRRRRYSHLALIRGALTG